MKEYKLKINGTEYAVNIKSIEDNIASLSVNGAEYEVEVEGMVTRPSKPTKVVQAPKAPNSDQPVVVKAPAAASNAGAVKSPLPGVVLDVAVREGDTVKIGQKLLVLEAMKMENNIDSDRDGVVDAIKVRKGDSVLEGDVLITIK